MTLDPAAPQNAIGALSLAIFRLNGSLIATGNLMVADLGLTSASWQVIGALAFAGTPLPVAHIARNMRLARQSVQRVVDQLAEASLVRFEANAHHRRAKLVVLTDDGRAAMEAAQARQSPWAEDLLDRLGADRVTAAVELLTQMETLVGDAAKGRDKSL